MRHCAWLLLLVGCTADDVPEGPAPDPVVVYVAYEDNEAIRATLDRYTKATGVPVIDRRGDTEKIVDDLITNRITPPADLLLTRSVVPAWIAAEESALRPLYSDAIAAPDWAMDPDKLWFAISADRAVVAYHGDAPALADVADLAEDTFANDLCLSSSSRPINRAVIAMLIDELGIRPAELVVRGWVSNLARSPFAEEELLAAAIEDGGCRVGIVSESVAVRSGIGFIEPATRYAEIAAVGVARHARNPDGAARLAEWLIAGFARQADHRDGKNVGLVAWHYDEAVKLAERARYH